MNNVDENVIRYPATIVVGNWRIATFKKVNAQGLDSMNKIKYYGMEMYADGVRKSVETNDFDENTMAIPIRIAGEEDSRNICCDWCTYGSTIQYIHNDSIPRWWPIDWIHNNNELPKYIDIDLGTFAESGERIIIACKVEEKPTSEIMNTCFADIVFDEDVQNSIPHTLYNNKENEMFFSKKKEEPTIEVNETAVVGETPVVQEQQVEDEVVISEKINQSEQINVETGDDSKVSCDAPIDPKNNSMEAKIMAETKEVKEVNVDAIQPSKPKKALIYGGLVLGGVAIGVLGTLAVQHFTSKESAE